MMPIVQCWIKDLCEENKTEKNLFTTNNYTLMERSLYVVNGFGYMCHRKRITVKTVQYFFGGKDKFRNEIIEILNREDCLAMVISRKCQHQDMICNNDQCSSIMEPEIKYAWFNELNFFSFHCYMHKLEIKGHQLNLPQQDKNKRKIMKTNISSEKL